MAVLSVVASTTVVPEPGVESDNPGGIVWHVDPGSPTWRAGIRAGELVTSLQGSDAPGGWELWTSDGTLAKSTGASDQVAILRRHMPWSMVALAMASVAALLAYRGQPAAAVLLPIALFSAAQPLFVAGSFAAGILAGIALFVGSAISSIAFSTWRATFSLPLVAGFALAILWVTAILAAPMAFDSVDAARGPAAAGLSVIGFAAIADRKRVTAFVTGQSAPAFVDLLIIGSVVAVLVAGATGLVPITLAVLLAIALAAIYPVSRRAMVSGFEQLVTSQARRDASIRAVESERGRLAREIHDSPLQELSGVIRRLDTVPGAAGEADALRLVAAHLRDVATTLHPPVLQDLGLAAALEDLRDQVCAARAGWTVQVEVDDLTAAGRPPEDVELAAFRVTQEAVMNAIAHSGGTDISIAGSVSPEAIELAIGDNGHGLQPEAAREAKRRGHFGLDSMRERARSIDGTLTITSQVDGVSVQFYWEAGP